MAAVEVSPTNPKKLTRCTIRRGNAGEKLFLKFKMELLILALIFLSYPRLV
jgi:hypothetical protein